MTIAGMVKSSLVDFAGLVACVLFTPGCNYDCFFCHNRQLIDGTHQVLQIGAVQDFLRKRAGQLDGVVLTGGEPTLQPDLPEFIEEIRKLGYQVKLDTNGSAPQIIERILDDGHCGYFAVDYKAPSYRYKDICRAAADAEMVLCTIRLLLERGADFEVRTTVLPQLGDDDLMLMAQELPAVRRYVLNHYRKPERYRPDDVELVNEMPWPPKHLAVLAENMRRWQPNITV